MTYYDARIKKFQKSMKCSYAVLVSEEDVNPTMFYFTGLTGYGILIIPKKAKPFLLASVLDIGNTKNKGIKAISVTKSFREDIRKIIPKRKSIGFDMGSLNVSRFNLLKKILKPSKLIDVSQELLEQRSIKDNYEIKQIKTACDVTCDILNSCIKHIHHFNHEYGIKNYLDGETKRRGYDVAYDTIVASGKNASNPHYSSCKDRLRRGFLVIDFGVKVNGYCADLTRTFFLGNPTSEEKKMYDLVLDVQKRCIGMLKKESPNMADAYARKELGEKFIHSLGHGIGLQIHELPNINKHNKKILQNGSCFTVEPGIYDKNKYGIRIEDDLVKTGNKIKILTPFTKNLVIINKKLYK